MRALTVLARPASDDTGRRDGARLLAIRQCLSTSCQHTVRARGRARTVGQGRCRAVGVHRPPHPHQRIDWSARSGRVVAGVGRRLDRRRPLVQGRLVPVRLVMRHGRAPARGVLDEAGDRPAAKAAT
ncbi:hypothetical protein GCM10010182_18630 [Actinomadura cremea]|nr:hypothetical protein GCM10010182_18630 [Actinomadura cremea]